jgi:hypothetical protein
LPHLGGNSPNTTASSNGKTVTIDNAVPFDPFGDGSENNDKADAVKDGDPSTMWQTEGYDDPAIKVKPGVGLYVTLPKSTSLASLKVNSPTNGWSAQIYVADGPKDSLDGWGAPVATKSDIASGTTAFDLKGTKGSAVLIWITNVGSDADDSGRFHTRIADVTVDQK